MQIHFGSDAVQPQPQFTIPQLTGNLMELMQFNASGARKEPISQEKFEQIRSTFKSLKQRITSEYPQNRKRDSLEVLRSAYQIMVHLVYLRNGCSPWEKMAAYVDGVLEAIQQTTKLSHDQFFGPLHALENRRLQISLGLVEALTEMLVLDVEIFGLHLDGYDKCSKLRRSIGNSLMNLVYQQRDAKLKLCTNLVFLRRVADIIAEVFPLVQFYAGLIQNVSYNADIRISHYLAITVPPLVRTALSIACDKNGDSFVHLGQHHKQHLLKVLSALWNLAENPVENKRVMCHDEPKFVPLLLHIMRSDQRELHFIQAAAGIFKHLSSFIIQYPDLFSNTIRSAAIPTLLRQLSSSSPDLIIDALCTLSIFSRHVLAAQQIKFKPEQIQQINCLVRSTNEGISREARTLLDSIFSSTVVYKIQNVQQLEQNAPSGDWSPQSAQSCEHLQDQIAMEKFDQKAQFSTFPRTSQKIESNSKADSSIGRQSFGVEDKGSHVGEEEDGTLVNVDENVNIEAVDPSKETGLDLSTSVQCTREITPRSSSFNSTNENEVGHEQEWPSVHSSPASGTGGHSSSANSSDLPASPSQCATHKPFQLEAIEMKIQKALIENTENDNVKGTGEEIDHKDKTEDGGTSADNYDGTNYEGNELFLAQVIRDYMPKPSSAHNLLNPTPMLTPISTNSPCKSPALKDERKDLIDGGRLLEESIAAAMPNTRRALKGEAKGSSELKITQQARHQNRIPRIENSPSTQNKTKILSAFKRESKTMSSQMPTRSPRSKNNSCCDENHQLGQIFSSEIPTDVVEEIQAHWITVDCGKVGTDTGKDGRQADCGIFSTPTSSSSARSRQSNIPKLFGHDQQNWDRERNTLLKKSPAKRTSESVGSPSFKGTASPQKNVQQQKKYLPPPLPPKPKLSKPLVQKSKGQ